MKRKRMKVLLKGFAMLTIVAVLGSNNSLMLVNATETDGVEDVSEEITENETNSEETTDVSDNEENLENEITSDKVADEENADEEKNTELQAATNLGWSDTDPGNAVFYNPNEESVSIWLTLYQDGEPKHSWELSAARSCQISVETDAEIMESGIYTYYVRICAYGEEMWNPETTAIDSAESSEFVYERPSAVLEAPKNIVWNSETGNVSWDSVEHADWYWCFLDYTDEYWGYVTDAGSGSGLLSCNFADNLAAGREYYVKVRAVSENINLYANSDWSEYIPLNISEIGNTINDKLDEVMGEITVENVVSVVDTVKDTFSDSDTKNELQIAMQTDSEVREKVQNLENLYKDTMNLTTSVNTSEDLGIDEDSVQLLGAALNATEENGSITFNMSKPDEETQKQLLTSSGFSNAIVLDLELEGAGIEKGETLDVPVTVTMNVPTGIELSRMTILHFNEDGTYETLPIRRNADGTISFTVTHFSNFVFGEKEETSSSTGMNNVTSTENDSYGITSMNQNGYVWAPETEDEIYRYAFFGKEDVEYVEDAANAYSVTILNEMQGRLCFDSFESVLGDYTIGRTYNIFPEDRVVYKMDNVAKITLTIPEILRADNREYKMICVTENGLPILLDDMDEVQETITFETDSYYAFALIYIDEIVAE